MSDDVYRRAGRGGAGNYYSKQDIAEVDKRLREQDPEAQRPIPADPLPTDPADPPAPASSATAASSSSAYARSGRGGAGNFVDPAEASSAAAAAPASTGTPAAAPATASSSSTAAAPRYSGRGGAGNYSHFNPSAAPVVDEEQERKRKEMVDSGILKEIQESLPKPPRIYHMHDGGAKNSKTRASEPEI
ncbi:uncharacterized protein B0I36DRAFT_358383 [Microdochium trichocladiopsis]|uniref:Uncharacterized protein n=1 Tax=Microdochium trichocladiopsis TaxID=1682393 RepID=A0A9P8YIV3_9PEZI|nr:uncharacterized protein B0I36DRAFT_358383 [Microdochium trichocladiopsis]KAH7041194.1 hypothetical protein B0I36DRAFT_358383 [Microdochium trichocladiopsis]